MLKPVRPNLPTGTVTLLLTDIEGSTQLLNRLGSAGYARALDLHRQLIRAAFQHHNGVEVDTQGDAFFAAFPGAIDGVLAAAEIQNALQHAQWEEGAAVRVRIGIHTGEPRAAEEGYVGFDVHLAARIAAAGHGSQVLISERTAQLVREELDNQDLSLLDLNKHRLKDVPENQRLFQLVQKGLRQDFPELRTLAGRPTNLPTNMTAFVGRENMVQSLRQLLEEPAIRVVSITGAGGAGKSRTALRVARELLPHFTDGVFFVPLATARAPDEVLVRIACVLKVADDAQGDDYGNLVEHLRSRSLLLVLDNFEQVLGAANRLGQLLRDCPSLKVLVTSREMLRLSGERVFALPPLTMPPQDKRLTLEEIGEFEAISLFVDRAHAARSDFTLTAANVEDVVDICRQVDALPLAIELAAARIRSMAPDRLRKAMRRRLKVLTGGAADLLDHQRTLSDLIAWSYELLEPDERMLWRRLGIFTDGATLEAAQAVCDLDDDLEVEIDIDALVAKSLVRMEFDSTAGGVDKVISADHAQPRIMMLHTMRDYALLMCDQEQERDPLALRHYQYFLNLAERSEQALRGPEANTWTQRLGLELANFRAAYEFSRKQPADAALRLASALWFFMYQVGRLAECEQWLEDALAAGSDAAPELRARALLGLCGLLRQQGHMQQARTAGEEALSLYQQAEAQDGEARALAELGAVVERMGEQDHAAKLLDSAVRLFRELGNKERLSFTLVALGALHHIGGRLEDAHECYIESRDLARALGDGHAVATATVNLGELEQLRGNPAAAAELYRQSLAVYANLKHSLAIAYCLEVLASISNEEGDAETGAMLLGHANALRENIDAPMESFNLERYQRDLAAITTALGRKAFDHHWHLGSVTPTEEVVANALGIQVEQIGQVVDGAIRQA